MAILQQQREFEKTVRGTRNLEETKRGAEDLEDPKRGAGNLEETGRGDLEFNLYDSDNLNDLEDSRNNLEDLRSNLDDSRDHTGDIILPQDSPIIFASDIPKGGITRGATEESKL